MLTFRHPRCAHWYNANSIGMPFTLLLKVTHYQDCGADPSISGSQGTADDLAKAVAVPGVLEVLEEGLWGGGGGFLNS